MRRLIRLVPLLFAVTAAACDLLGSDESNLVAYRLTTSLNDGVYQLKVIHNFGAAQPAETVLDTQITVT